MKGEIACYSCFAKNPSRSSAHSKFSAMPLPSTLQNMTNLVAILGEGGMNIPLLLNTCADTPMSGNPTFLRSSIHVCANNDEEPGACVKFKGHYNGESFVYRECWSRMWKYPRPYRPQMSGHCFADEMVQTFVASTRNVICFCEDDLCNGYRSVVFFTSTLAFALFLLVFLFFIIL
uniref:Protein sleepless n=1 Tax=Steinernema glaseri TaxID=37863 RepID=A0A1I8A363_9BILA